MATDILGNFLAGQQAGQQQRTKRTLSEFLQPALGGDQNALSQVYAADPDAGLQVQGMVQKQQSADHDQKMGQLELASRAWRAATPETRQQLYPSIAELTESVLPQFAGKIPREYSPQYEANIDKFLAGFAPVEDNTPAAIRELQILQANPELAALDMKRRTAGFDRPQLIQTDSGYAWATPQGATPLNYGGQGEAAPAIDQSAVQRNLAMLGASPGVQMTSGLRTPERNAAVGGKPNSQHLRGTAGDYVVPQAQKADFMQQVEAAGLQAIDEGDHVHVQQPRGGSRVMPAQKGSGPSEFEKKIDMARAMGATPAEIKQMVIGREGAAAGAKPLPIGAVKELLSVEDAIGASKIVSDIITKHANRMSKGELEVYPEDAMGARFRTAIGRSNANDVNVNEFRADMTRIVNESLRLNAGVQTEGDAQRSAQELMAANDQKTAARAMKRLAELNQRAVQLQRQKQALIRKNYGQDAEGNPLGQQQEVSSDDEALISKWMSP